MSTQTSTGVLGTSRCAAALGLALLAGSCAVERVLAVESDPPGASVQLDGQPIGNTPLEHRFQHYGKRLLTINLTGYSTWNRQLALRTPWWSYFPLDIVSEVVLPFGWKDRHEVRAQLVPHVGEVAVGDLREVLRRAEALRSVTNPDADQPAQPASEESEGEAPRDEGEAPPGEDE